MYDYADDKIIYKSNQNDLDNRILDNYDLPILGVYTPFIGADKSSSSCANKSSSFGTALRSARSNKSSEIFDKIILPVQYFYLGPINLRH